MKTDVCSVDSDADGLTDYHEAVLANRIEPKNPIDVEINCANYVDNCDADSDGVSDFKETHGFYYSQEDSRFYAASRLISLDEWDELAKTPVQSENQLNPWAVAINALEYSGYKRLVTVNGSQYVALNIEAARKVIIQAFLDIFANENHIFLKGGSNESGSVSNILNTLLVKPSYEKDLAGKDINIFYTDSTRYSTDLDPMSDAEEVSRVNLLPDVIHPADHPLVSGYPRIKPILVGLTITPKRELKDSKGESASKSWSVTLTETSSSTSGWNVGGSMGGTKGYEKGDGATNIVSPSVGFGYSSTKTNMSSTSKKDGESNTVDFRTVETSDSICDAIVTFTMKFKNVGTATVYNLMPAFNLYIGEKQTPYTFVADALSRNAYQIKSLSPGDTSDVLTFPFVGQSSGARNPEVCLSLNDLAYIENDGGNIAVDVIPNNAEIAFFNPQKGRVESEGEWPIYQSLIESVGATIDYTLIDEANKVHQGNYIAYAGSSPSMSLGEP